MKRAPRDQPRPAPSPPDDAVPRTDDREEALDKVSGPFERELGRARPR
jgi:hypothetical protein